MPAFAGRKREMTGLEIALSLFKFHSEESLNESQWLRLDA